MREKKREYRAARREKQKVQGKRRGGATVCNRGSRKREETSIGAAKRGGKASGREGGRRRGSERGDNERGSYL